MNRRSLSFIVAASAFVLLAVAASLAFMATTTRAAAPDRGVPAAAKPGAPNAPSASNWVDIAPFPTVTIEFTPVATSLKLKRAGAAAYPPNGKVYLLGGRHGTDGEDTSMRNIWEYTPGSPGTWISKTALLDTTDVGGRQTANMAVAVLTDSS